MLNCSTYIYNTVYVEQNLNIKSINSFKNPFNRNFLIKHVLKDFSYSNNYSKLFL